MDILHMQVQVPELQSAILMKHTGAKNLSVGEELMQQ